MPTSELLTRTVAPPVTLNAPPSKAAWLKLRLEDVMLVHVAPLATKARPLHCLQHCKKRDASY